MNFDRLRFLVQLLVGITLASSLHAQLQRLPDPPGSATAFTEIRGVSGRVYAASHNGVWITNNHMQAWRPAGLQGHRITRILGYQEGHRETVLAASDSSIYRSNDSGSTWTNVYSNQDFQFGTFGLIRDDSILIAVGYETIMRSMDNGDNWSLLANTPTNTFGEPSVALCDHNLFLCARSAGGWNQVWEMPDSGGTWSVNFHVPNRSIKDQGTNFMTTFDSILCVGGVAGIDYSTNGGRTWISPQNKGLGSDPDFVEYVQSFATDSHTFVISTAYGLYRSTDSAKSWTHLDGQHGYPSYYGPSRAYPAAVVDYLDTRFISAEPGGVFVSSDTRNWDASSRGITSVNVTDLATDGTILYAVVDGAVFHSLDSGTTWQTPADFEHTGSWSVRLVKHIEEINGAVFARSDDGRLARWTKGLLAVFTVPVISSDIAALHDTLFAIGNGDRVIRSTNLGVTWDSVSLAPAELAVPDVASFNDTLFYFANESGYWSSHLSVDGGVTWKPLNGYAFGSGDPQEPLVSVSGNSSLLTACTLYDLSFSVDRGLHWQSYARREGIAIFTTNWGDSVVIGIQDTTPSASGLYLAGSKLKQILPATETSTIQSSMILDTFAYLGSVSRGIWRLTLHPKVGTQSSVNRAKHSATDLNFAIYPNPVSESTGITFKCEDIQYATVCIENILGVEVAHLYTGKLAAGEHRFDWNRPIQLPSGIYECVLRIDGQVLSLPISLVR